MCSGKPLNCCAACPIEMDALVGADLGLIIILGIDTLVVLNATLGICVGGGVVVEVVEEKIFFTTFNKRS